MVLDAKNALKFIPSGLCEHGKLAQVGIDLSIKDIRKIVGGKLYHDGKKEIDKYQDVDHILEPIEEGSEETVKTWLLTKGVYSLTFDQSIKLDNKHCAEVIGRSTTNRIGLFIRSAQFDPGFECPNIGATMYVFEDNLVEIQEGACLAQIKIEECEESEEYNGDYQGDKDLK